MSPVLETFGDIAARGWERFGPTGAGGNALELISTQILSTTAATITFSSIPSTYKHLQLRVVSRTDRSGVVNNIAMFRFNGSSTSYNYHQLTGDGSSVSSGYSGTSNAMLAASSAGATATTGIFGAGIIDILDYTSASKNKTIRSLHGLIPLSSQAVELASGLWANTAAISSITLFPIVGPNFIAGSRFSLYGILG